MVKALKLQRKGHITYLLFKNNLYRPDEKEVNDAIMLAIYQNKCAGANTKLMGHGVIELTFNPTQQNRIERKMTEETVKALIINS
ncbi:MAG: hypothetical protein MJ154_01465 [Candidatus Saccharibacteria bacterium]|nr:hypothetical protein [Candidatus Saccharibacteria bacterium]